MSPASVMSTHQGVISSTNSSFYPDPAESQKGWMHKIYKERLSNNEYCFLKYLMGQGHPSTKVVNTRVEVARKIGHSPSQSSLVNIQFF